MSTNVANVKLPERKRSRQGSLYIYSNYTTGFPVNNKSIIENLINYTWLTNVKEEIVTVLFLERLY